LTLRGERRYACSTRDTAPGMAHLRNRLRAELATRQMSLAELARLTEIPYPTVQRVARPHSNPFLDNALRIAKVLGVPLERLFRIEVRPRVPR
jgi:transcriptional regulator with XRE-family HTH domain